MESIFLTAFLAVYGAFTVIYAFVMASRKPSGDRLLSDDGAPTPAGAVLSGFGTDIGFWFFAALPALTVSAVNGTVRAAAFAAGLFAAAVAGRFVFPARLRLYAEILGFPQSIAEFLEKRLCPKYRFTRLYFGTVTALFSLMCAAGALSLGASLLSMLVGTDYVASLLILSGLLLVCLLLSGLGFPARAGVLQGVAVVAAFGVLLVFSVLRLSVPASPEDDPFIRSVSFAEVPGGLSDMIMYFFGGFCLLGTPSFFTRMMRARNRRTTRHGTGALVAVYLIAAVMMLGVCLYASGFGKGLDSLLLLAGSLDTPFLGAFVGSSLLLALFGASSVHLAGASGTVCRDLIADPQEKRRLPDYVIRAVTALGTVAVFVTALLLKNSAMPLFLFGAACLAAVLVPVLAACLFSAGVTPLAAIVSSAAGLCTALLFRLYVPAAAIMTVLPAMGVTAAVLAVFIICTRRADPAAVNAFERARLLARTKGDDLYARDKTEDDL